MNIRVQQQTLTSLESDLLVLPVVQEGQSGETVQMLSSALNGALQQQIVRSGFTGKEGETLLFHTQGRLPSRSVLLMGLGRAESMELETWRRLAGKSGKEAKSQGAKHLAWFFAAGQGRDEVLTAVGEGVSLSGYAFDKYKSEKMGSLL